MENSKSVKSNTFNWLNSGAYKKDIDKAITQIAKQCNASSNEAQTSDVFTTVLYALIYNNTGLYVNFNKETKVGCVFHTFKGLEKRKSGHGRLDALVNNIIIEFKHHSKLKNNIDIESAYNQVEDYMKAMYSENGTKCDAILTDGIKIAFFQFGDNEIWHDNLKPITNKYLDILIKAILNNNTKKVEPFNIVADFSIDPNIPSVSKDIAIILFNNLTSNPTEKTKMLFNEWMSLMHLSLNDSGRSRDIEKRRRDLGNILKEDIKNSDLEYKALYALQTTYAIIVKLIACKVIDNLNYNSTTRNYSDLLEETSDNLQDFFANMEDGYSYTGMNIRNFLEGDFFSWYADKNQWTPKFYNEIKKLLADIDDYSSFSLDVHYTPIDVFKDLYMSIIPQSVRHSMGEYFTPEWLSDRVITRALELVNKPNWKAIDPCCGSGIFLMVLIKKIVGDKNINDLSEKEREDLLNSILNRVYGIDINPLSVLSARVSYFLAIHKLGNVQNVELPVYLGDSAIIPEIKYIDNIECYYYTVNNIKNQSIEVVLPKRFVCQKDFGEKMNELQALVNTEDINILYNAIVNTFNETEKQSTALLKHIKKLAEQLTTLHKKNWDGIWIRITTNFMLIARLAKFDLITGNPPWVKWEHLPTEYTVKIRKYCDLNHVFTINGLYGGAQLNICALISNVTASNWLAETGILAFLMPDSIMSQNSYEEFRNFYIDYKKGKRLYLQELDRWMKSIRPFRVGKKVVSQDFCTYYYGYKKVDYKIGVPVKCIGKKGNAKGIKQNATTFDKIANNFVIEDWIAKQFSDESTAFTFCKEGFDYSKIIGPTSYLYRTGVESTPFEVFKLKAVSASRTTGNYRFENFQLKTSRYKVKDIPNGGWDFEVEFIYPMVEGPDITPFAYKSNGYHIIPYDMNDTQKPLKWDELYARSKNLATYFSKHLDLLNSQSSKSKTMHRGSEPYALSKIGPYTFADFIVAARDNTNFCASVIKPIITAWGEEKKTVCVKHTIIISQDVNHNFISEDEAFYIAGILNSTIVHSYIHNTFKTNGFSLNKSKLFIPKYDSNIDIFKDIVNLAKKATKDHALINEIQDKLTTKYLALCDMYNFKK